MWGFAPLAQAQPAPASVTPTTNANAQPAAASAAQPAAASSSALTPPQPTAAETEPDTTVSPHDEEAGPSPQPSSFEGDAWGDEQGKLNAGPLSFRILLQTRYEHTYAESSENTRVGYALREDVLVRDGDGYGLQRLFFRMAANPLPWVEFKTILDFAKLRGSDVSNVLKQAYFTLKPIPERVEIAAGVFKLPYSILELDPVARFELANLGDADEVIKNLGFGGRDVGVELMVAPLEKPRWLRLLVGAFRAHAKDENASPVGAIGARIESRPWKELRLGVDVVGMPSSYNYKQPFETSSKDVLPMPPDPLYPREQRWGSGKAYSADISYTRKRFTVRVEGLLGDRVDIDTRYNARSFGSVWALAAYRFKVGPLGLMPAARVEFMDTDREHKTGGRRALSFALNVLYKKSVRLVLDVTRTDVQGDTPVIEQPQPLALYPYLDLDNTRVTAQLQLEL